MVFFGSAFVLPLLRPFFVFNDSPCPFLFSLPACFQHVVTHYTPLVSLTFGNTRLLASSFRPASLIKSRLLFIQFAFLVTSYLFPISVAWDLLYLIINACMFIYSFIPSLCRPSSSQTFILLGFLHTPCVDWNEF